MITLTKAQSDAIIHRLDVIDALWDCYSGEHLADLEGCETPTWFYRLCVNLESKVRSRKLNDLTIEEKRILIDCVSGSTLVGIAIDAVEDGLKSPAYITQTHNMLRRIADKFSSWDKEPIFVPRC